MIIQVCGTCHKKLSFPPDKAGVKLSCPTCGDPFVVGVAPEDAEEEDAYGLAGAPKIRKPTPKTVGGSGAAAGPKPAPVKEPDLPEGKVECPTCSEPVDESLDTCPYCGDLIQRGRKPKRKR